MREYNKSCPKHVEQRNAPVKNLFKLSRRGLKELTHWIETETEAALIRDPFLIKIFVGHLIPSKKLLVMIENQKKKRQNILQKYFEIEKKYFAKVTPLPLPMKFQHLVIRRGISHSKNLLECIQEVEAFVRSVD